MKNLTEKARAKLRMALVKAVFTAPTALFTTREWRYLLDEVATKFAHAYKQETGKEVGTRSEAGISLLVIADRLNQLGELENALPEYKQLVENER
jgi:hypothetical protein